MSLEKLIVIWRQYMMILHNEEVTPIPGLVDYFISTSGNVYSTKADPNGFLLNRRIGKNGYVQVSADGSKELHRLLTITFIPIPVELQNIPALEVNHKDGNKLNNKLANLEWSTRLLNQQHAYLQWSHNRAKQIIAIPINELAFECPVIEFVSLREAAKYFNLSPMAFSEWLTKDRPLHGYFVRYKT